MSPKSDRPREYRGVVIFRNTNPAGLRWVARSLQADPLAADTLAGMRELIRNSEESKS